MEGAGGSSSRCMFQHPEGGSGLVTHVFIPDATEQKVVSRLCWWEAWENKRYVQRVGGRRTDQPEETRTHQVFRGDAKDEMR